MINIFKFARQQLLTKSKYQKYLLYAIGEILLVMIGILLAIQVNNWNDRRNNREEENQTYQNIKRLLAEDGQIIQSTIAYNNKYYQQYKYAIDIIEADDRSNIDTFGYIALNLTKYSNFDRQSNIYESLVNSGEAKLLANKEILDWLQRLEETYIYFNRMEDIHYDFIIRSLPEYIKHIKYSNRQIQNVDELYTYQFQNLIIIFLEIMDEKDEIYRKALDQIDTLTRLINEELDIKM